MHARQGHIFRGGQRDQVFRRGKGKCFHCGVRLLRSLKHYDHPRFFTVDHLKPLAFGGKSDKANTVACCRQCNLQRRHRAYLAETAQQEMFTGVKGFKTPQVCTMGEADLIRRWFDVPDDEAVISFEYQVAKAHAKKAALDKNVH